MISRISRFAEGERAYLPVEKRSLILPYSDLAEEPHRIATLDVHEILASKYFLLTDRDEPRDLFDLWWGLEKAGISFAAVAGAHRAKYGYGPDAHALQQVRRLQQLWAERLANQIRDLPPFESVVQDVAKHLPPASQTT